MSRKNDPISEMFGRSASAMNVTIKMPKKKKRRQIDVESLYKGNKKKKSSKKEKYKAVSLSSLLDFYYEVTPYNQAAPTKTGYTVNPQAADPGIYIMLVGGKPIYVAKTVTMEINDRNASSASATSTSMPIHGLTDMATGKSLLETLGSSNGEILDAAFAVTQIAELHPAYRFKQYYKSFMESLEDEDTISDVMSDWIHDGAKPFFSSDEEDSDEEDEFDEDDEDLEEEDIPSDVLDKIVSGIYNGDAPDVIEPDPPTKVPEVVPTEGASDPVIDEITDEMVGEVMKEEKEEEEEKDLNAELGITTVKTGNTTTLFGHEFVEADATVSITQPAPAENAADPSKPKAVRL